MIPSLRDRKEDIPALINYFIEKKAREVRLLITSRLAKGAIERLRSYSWPGNVRELENVIERAIILCKSQPLTFHDMIWFNGECDPAISYETRNEFQNLDSVISGHIQQALKMSKGRVNRPGGAAELLGINPGTLRHRMKKLGIPYGRINNVT